MARFIQKSILDKADTFTKVLRLDPTDYNSMWHPIKLILALLLRSSNVSCIRGKSVEHDCLSVRSGTKRCLIAISKSLEKCPLNYLLARNLNWLVPDFICHKPDMCITHLKQCLFLLSESRHVEVRN